jgi:hypothetical protein
MAHTVTTNSPPRDSDESRKEHVAPKSYRSATIASRSPVFMTVSRSSTHTSPAGRRAGRRRDAFVRLWGGQRGERRAEGGLTCVLCVESQCGGSAFICAEIQNCTAVIGGWDGPRKQGVRGHASAKRNENWHPARPLFHICSRPRPGPRSPQHVLSESSPFLTVHKKGPVKMSVATRNPFAILDGQSPPIFFSSTLIVILPPVSCSNFLLVQPKTRPGPPPQHPSLLLTTPPLRPLPEPLKKAGEAQLRVAESTTREEAKAVREIARQLRQLRNLLLLREARRSVRPRRPSVLLV